MLEVTVLNSAMFLRDVGRATRNGWDSEFSGEGLKIEVHPEGEACRVAIARKGGTRLSTVVAMDGLEAFIAGQIRNSGEDMSEDAIPVVAPATAVNSLPGVSPSPVKRVTAQAKPCAQLDLF